MIIKKYFVRPFVFQKALFFIYTLLIFFLVVFFNGRVIASSNNDSCTIGSIQNKQNSYKDSGDKYDQYGAPIKNIENKVITAARNSLKNIEFEIIKTTPHDINAFTQGLVYDQRYLYESIGGLGTSEVRKVELKTGKVIKSSKLPISYFAEGLERVKNKLIQLTLEKNTALIYDVNSLNKLGTFKISGNGWGLVAVDNHLLISDGSSKLKVISSQTYQAVNTVNVTVNNVALDGINEMEYIKGMIYANIWPTDCIAIIEPKKLQVVAWINLSQLYPRSERHNTHSVLNGIAYDTLNDRILVTGKYWPYIYHIKLNSYPSQF